MTLYKPTILLNRLVVTWRGHHVYDETFKTGLNIIRGDNGSGKSTVLDLLVFLYWWGYTSMDR